MNIFRHLIFANIRENGRPMKKTITEIDKYTSYNTHSGGKTSRQRTNNTIQTQAFNPKTTPQNQSSNPKCQISIILHTKHTRDKSCGSFFNSSSNRSRIVIIRINEILHINPINICLIILDRPGIFNCWQTQKHDFSNDMIVRNPHPAFYLRSNIIDRPF